MRFQIRRNTILYFYIKVITGFTQWKKTNQSGSLYQFFKLRKVTGIQENFLVKSFDSATLTDTLSFYSYHMLHSKLSAKFNYQNASLISKKAVTYMYVYVRICTFIYIENLFTVVWCQCGQSVILFTWLAIKWAFRFSLWCPCNNRNCNSSLLGIWNYTSLEIF